VSALKLESGRDSRVGYADLRAERQDTRVEILQGSIDGAANGARAEGGDTFVDGNDAADLGGIDFLLRGGLVAFVRVAE